MVNFARYGEGRVTDLTKPSGTWDSKFLVAAVKKFL
jgi:hypothetical protein